MKILVITTGGTIGSVYTDDRINVSVNNSLPVIDMYKEEYGGDTSFEVVSPINILSENISVNDFEMLYITLKNVDYSKYDGVIVTCGSDNLAYICSFIGLVFHKENISVVATNMLLTEEKSNGFDNFTTAVENLKIKRDYVFVPWKNSDGVMHIYDATTILPVDKNCDVYSFGEGQKMSIDDDIPSISSSILMLTPYPLMNYNQINLENVDKVLHLTYHSATACKDSLIYFNDRCKEKDIKIYLCGIKKNQKLYDSTKSIIDSGVIPLYDIAFPCAYIMLMLNLI